MSTDLRGWIPAITNSASPTNFTVTVPTTNSACFYEVITIPLSIPSFQFALAVRSNINLNGTNVAIDSFDSSNTNYSRYGLYTLTRRKANGNVGAYLGLVGDTSSGQADIWGRVYTGPGTTQSDVQIGDNGAVGDLAWIYGANVGIEPGYWVGNYNLYFPDVAAPTPFLGQKLPAPQQVGWPYAGSIVLSGGNYTVAGSYAQNAPFVVINPSVLWVQGSCSLTNVTITNGGFLIIYVGTANGSGDSLSIAGNAVCNIPGYAANLPIYGLPSLTSISLAANAGFTGTIYAPEANLSVAGGGSDSMGAVVVNSITMNGHWNFHYDEHLQVVAPLQ